MGLFRAPALPVRVATAAAFSLSRARVPNRAARAIYFALSPPRGAATVTDTARLGEAQVPTAPGLSLRDSPDPAFRRLPPHWS